MLPYILSSVVNVKKNDKKDNGILITKTLSNGKVVVFETKINNNPQNRVLNTSTMWAKTLANPPYAAKSPHGYNVQDAMISTSETAKLQKEAENTIKNEKKPQFQVVYHGSGNEFDAFDHRYMGEGEGAQAHGWGTYVAVDSKVSKRYAKEMEKNNLHAVERKRLKGTLLDCKNDLDTVCRRKEFADKDVKRCLKEIREEQAYIEEKEQEIRVAIEKYGANSKEVSNVRFYNDDTIASSKRRVDHLQDTLMESLHYIQVEYKKEVEAAKQKIAEAQKLLDEYDATHQVYANLYSVETPDNNGSNYIEEDGSAEAVIQRLEAYNKRLEKDPTMQKYKKLLEAERKWKDDFRHNMVDKKTFIENVEIIYKQIAEIKTIIGEEIELSEFEAAKQVLEFKKKIKNGRELYLFVQKYFSEKGYSNSAKEASKFLNRAGIVGIHYNGRIDGECYVIFNEKDLKIIKHEKFWQKEDGTILGYVDKNGNIVLNSDEINANTPIHEFGHLWVEYINSINKELYKRGLDLIENTKYYEEVKRDSERVGSVYFGLSEAELKEEALVRAIGDKGEQFVGNNGKLLAFKMWLADLWRSVKNILGIKDKALNISSMTLEQVLNKAERTC